MDEMGTFDAPRIHFEVEAIVEGWDSLGIEAVTAVMCMGWMWSWMPFDVCEGAEVLYVEMQIVRNNQIERWRVCWRPYGLRTDDIFHSF